jgi:hypothetical protein
MPVNPHLKVYNLVESAVNHHLSVPEFQRGYVWKPSQVRDLAESLWLDYPIGSFLIWDSNKLVQPRLANDGHNPAEWLVDGQQRATALSILFGRKPYWWPSIETWNKTINRCDIRFDIEAEQPPYFWVPNAVIKKAKNHRYIKLTDLLQLNLSKPDDLNKLQQLARIISEEGLCPSMDVMGIYTKLHRVVQIREKDLVTITVDHELEDVVEIFARLNSKGTRVTEADIYLGIVASRTPGWVQETFLPYLKDMADYGFDINPNLLFKSLTAIAANKTRFRDIPSEIWNGETIIPTWEKTTACWGNLIKFMGNYGVSNNHLLPTETALVTLIALQHKFQTINLDRVFYWFLQASRFGRYSGSGTTSLDEDLKDIAESDSIDQAIRRLLNRIDNKYELEANDFLEDYGNSRFGRFLLYLLIWNNNAQDWDEQGYRIGFDGAKILRYFKPQWHHIFPKKYLRNDFEEMEISALANIAIIGPSMNIRISSRNPMNYIEKYQITDQKLEQQFINPNIRYIEKSEFKEFLLERAQALAVKANSFLGYLSRDL